MKKEKGFTLIELIGAIVILAVITLIAFPAILNGLKSGQDEVTSSVKDIVKSATNNYVNDYVRNNPNDNTYAKQIESISTVKTNGTVSVTTLVNNGYLEKTLIDKHCKIKNDTVTVTSNSKKYMYTYNDVPETGC